jgi:hypothetical protein
MLWLGRRFETVFHRVIWFLICSINAIGSCNEPLGYFRFRYERRSIEGREIRDLAWREYKTGAPRGKLMAVRVFICGHTRSPLDYSVHLTLQEDHSPSHETCTTRPIRDLLQATLDQDGR